MLPVQHEDSVSFLTGWFFRVSFESHIDKHLLHITSQATTISLVTGQSSSLITVQVRKQVLLDKSTIIKQRSGPVVTLQRIHKLKRLRIHSCLLSDISSAPLQLHLYHMFSYNFLPHTHSLVLSQAALQTKTFFTLCWHKCALSALYRGPPPHWFFWPMKERLLVLSSVAMRTFVHRLSMMSMVAIMTTLCNSSSVSK